MTLYQIGNSDLSLRMEYDANDNPIYVGEAAAGAEESSSVWRIKKVTFDTNDNATKVQWASGTAVFDKSWNNRVSYSYS